MPGRKIAKLAPQLNSIEREDIRAVTVKILEQLARDQFPKIRQILAESLKEVANAPPSVIRQLAEDDELIVSVPVLANSPVLTDDDLFHIINRRPKSGALSAIANRLTVSTGISDAIVNSDAKDAITDLLKNDSAQIREETLDMLVERSQEVAAWQEPLVRRPLLQIAAALRLAEFVADNYLHILEKRQDFDQATLMRVKEEVHRRIALSASEIAEVELPEEEDDDESVKFIGANIDASLDISLTSAKRLKREGKLEPKDIELALRSGDRKFVRSALAVRADIDINIVEKIIELRSAKGVTAVAWKADLPMRLATDLQSKLAGISNADLINPRNGFDYPMSDDELASELAFFTE